LPICFLAMSDLLSEPQYALTFGQKIGQGIGKKRGSLDNE